MCMFLCAYIYIYILWFRFVKRKSRRVHFTLITGTFFADKVDVRKGSRVTAVEADGPRIYVKKLTLNYTRNCNIYIYIYIYIYVSAHTRVCFFTPNRNKTFYLCIIRPTFIFMSFILKIYF